MSWSSEFDPGSENAKNRGRKINLPGQSPPESQRPSEEEPKSASQLARQTIRLTKPKTPKPPKTPRPKNRNWLPIIAGAAAFLLLGGALLYLATTRDGSATVDQPRDTRPSSFDGISLTTLRRQLDTSQITFEPGTAQVTPESLEVLRSLRSALAAEINETISFSVRTYTQDSPAENHKLSIEQAEAIRQVLLEDSSISESRVMVRGLGSAEITEGGDLDHFITLSAPTSGRKFQTSLRKIGSFALTSDPETATSDDLDATALGQTAELLITENEPVVVKIYRFGQPQADAAPSASTTTTSAPTTRSTSASTTASNPTTSTSTPDSSSTSSTTGIAQGPERSSRNDIPNDSALGAAITQYLVGYGLDSEAITVEETYNEPVVVGSGVNNIVNVSAGAAAETTARLSEIEPPTFKPGSDELTQSAQNSLDETITTILELDATLVIDVHTFSQQTAEDNADLSTRQAQAIATYLEEAGVPSDRVRPVGSGNSDQFDESGKSTIVVLHAVPSMP